MRKHVKLFTFFMLFLIISNTAAYAQDNISVFIDGKEKLFSSSPVLINSKVYVPFREIFEVLGAKVNWQQETNEVTAVKGKRKIKLKLNNKKDGCILRNGKTLVPLRFVSEALGERVGWNSKGQYVHIGKEPSPSAIKSKQNSIASEVRNLNINGKKFRVNIVTADLSANNLSVRTVLAKDRLCGKTESLSSMAKRCGAIAAINGTYFNAYEDIKDPAGNIIINNKPVYMSNFGTTIGIADDKEVKFDRVNFKVKGISDDGTKINWVAYGMNRYQGKNANSIMLYTPERGSHTGIPWGTSVIVQDKVIKSIVDGDAAIPRNGFVIKLFGKEKRFLDRFPKGAKAYYTVEFNPQNTDSSFWERVDSGLGVGPRLLTCGKVSVDPVKEGFSSQKILSYRMARSAIGITNENKLKLVTVNGANMTELAQIMKTLGARDAMNLDGGASSGLYYRGKYMTTPGRNLSNALLICPKN